MPKTLEAEIKEFVKEVNEKAGGIEVNWQGLAGLQRKLILEGDGSRSWQPLFENLLDYLTERGILTRNAENSWTLTDGVADLSPKKPAPYSQLYFRRREDARAYKDAFYTNAALKVNVRRARVTV